MTWQELLRGGVGPQDCLASVRWVSASAGRQLTSEAVDIEAAMLVGEAGLVGEEEESLDTRQAPTTALAGCDNGIAHAAISQPAGAAAVQSAIPGGIQLARGGNLCTPLPAVCLGLLQRQLVWGGTQEQLSWWGRGHWVTRKLVASATLGSHRDPPSLSVICDMESTTLLHRIKAWIGPQDG